jgi:hypothetical protein
MGQRKPKYKIPYGIRYFTAIPIRATVDGQRRDPGEETGWERSRIIAGSVFPSPSTTVADTGDAEGDCDVPRMEPASF